MTYCSYCEEWAVIRIPAEPAAVCLEHALEYWTGLLSYAREQHAEPSESPEAHAACPVCHELSAARARTMAAIDAAGPAPEQPLLRPVPHRVAAPEPLRLASARRATNVATITARVKRDIAADEPLRDHGPAVILTRGLRAFSA
jgi:hypothetical protein